MSRFAHDCACARENGEVVPSLVKLRRFKGREGYPASIGYYNMRFTFRPLTGQPLGEAICVQPDEIEEVE